MQQLLEKQHTLNLSPTLAINESVNMIRRQGGKILHMGFGEAPFPAPKRMVESLQKYAHEKSYLPVMGLPALRDAIAGYQASVAGIDMNHYEVIVGPGSKLILFAMQMAIPGDVILPTPSWVSYQPQAALLGQSVIRVGAHLSDDGYVIAAEDLESVIYQARINNKKPTKLIINFPNNPSGLTMTNDSLQDIVEVCIKHNIHIISDEIYGRLSYDQHYRSLGALHPEALITTGLSKHLSLGGWRVGVGLIPKRVTGLLERVNHIASELWSSVPAPIQHASIQAYLQHDDIEKFITDTTAIHALVNRYIANRLQALGVVCPTPQGGFYNWPDFTHLLKEIFDSSNDLSMHLLSEYGLATLPGSAFGEDTSRLTLRLSGCDYDGAQAMKFWQTRSSKLGVEALVESIAPNVVSAIQVFSDCLSAR